MVLSIEYVINYKSEFVWGQCVCEFIGGCGVDYVIEVGGLVMLLQLIEVVCIGGYILLIGVFIGCGGEIFIVVLMVKQVCLQGIIVGSCIYQQEMIVVIDVGGLWLVIDFCFVLDDIVDVFWCQVLGQYFGKIVLEFQLLCSGWFIEVVCCLLC